MGLSSPGIHAILFQTNGDDFEIPCCMFPTRRQQKLANKEALDAIRQKNPLPPAAVNAVQCDNGCSKNAAPVFTNPRNCPFLFRTILKPRGIGIIDGGRSRWIILP